jgi:hypothetical protein
MSQRATEFYLVNDRPVKVIGTPDGGLDVLVFDLQQKKFVSDMSYLPASLPAHKDVDAVNETQFLARVSQLGGAPEVKATTLAVWDTSNSVAWLGLYETSASGAILIRHETVAVDIGARKKRLQQQGQRQGSTCGGFAVWAFDDTGEIWSKSGCLASGPRGQWKVGATPIPASSVVAVASFYDNEDYGHRGVKLELRGGTQLLVIEEFDAASKHDPTYNWDNLLEDGAWTSELSRDLAKWLQCAHRDALA